MVARTLYFECYSGISGDMAVAALLDLGADTDALRRALDSLHLDGFSVRISRVSKSGLDACDFDVVLDEDNHDHDPEYLYGDRHNHRGHHGHEHRGLPEIVGIIDSADMSTNAKDIAKRTFTILAEAESKAHGVPVEEVHFHEVGAVDSIVDIVSFAVCLDDLGIPDVCFSELYEGTGYIRCQHGVLPIPVPAVANIVSAHGLRMRITGSEGEYVTPTGAAFAAAVGNRRTIPTDMVIERIGMGAGKRESERSGILRAMILRPGSDEEHVFKLECNIDDCSGETLGYTMERLFAEGARDVHFTPIFMKKNRPAQMLTVICREEDIARMEDIMFRETTTIGIRRCPMERTVMDREVREVETPIGRVSVKVCRHRGIVKAYPEYESLVAVCKEKGIPYREAYEIVIGHCKQ